MLVDATGMDDSPQQPWSYNPPLQGLGGTRSAPIDLSESRYLQSTNET